MTAEENNGVESRKRERQTAEGQPVKEDGRVLINHVKHFYATANHPRQRLNRWPCFCATRRTTRNAV